MRKPDIAYFTVDKKRDARLIDFGRWEEKFIPETKEILWMKTQSNFL